MATSGTTSFNLPVDEIIEEALSLVGGEHVTYDEIRQARRALNLLFIEMRNRGYPLAKLEQIVVSVSSSVQSYTLPSSIVAVMDATYQTTSDGIKTGMQPISLIEFNHIPRPLTYGNRSSQYTIDKGRDNLTISLWTIPNTDSAALVMWVVKKIEDVTRSNQDVDFNVKYLPAVIYGLAHKMSLKREGITAERRAELKALFEEAFTYVLEEDKEQVDLTIGLYLNTPTLRSY